jgi:hypothetical protein
MKVLFMMYYANYIFYVLFWIFEIESYSERFVSLWQARVEIWPRSEPALVKRGRAKQRDDICTGRPKCRRSARLCGRFDMHQIGYFRKWYCLRCPQ